jgi:CheY-like chemotaxis protein
MSSQTTPLGLRVLVVDDHEGSARVLAVLLSREGHDVITAGSARDALAAARVGRPVDVLLSDISLPDVDGCELLRRLRLQYGRDFRAVAITGNGEASDVEQCRLAGFSRLLLKPIDFSELLAVLREMQTGSQPGGISQPVGRHARTGA